MSRLKWDRSAERFYKTGVDRGVLFLCDKYGNYDSGIAWNGLTNVTENPSGAEPTPFWADNAKYLNILSAEDFGCTIEAYSFPVAFRPCLGKRSIADGVTISQQNRQSFGFCYRTLVGNDMDGNDWSYEIHIIYGCLASPPEKSNKTESDNPEIVTLSWEVSTLPVRVDGFKPTSTFVFSGPVYKKRGLMNVLRAIENILYGSEDENSRIPTLTEISEIYVYERYILDSDEENILDSEGRPIESFVPN